MFDEDRSLSTRREFIGQTVAVACALGMASNYLAEAQSTPLKDAPATHNMLVIGQTTMYLSHLPMFNQLNSKKTDYSTPHRFQVILEARLTAPSGDPQKVYFEDRRRHPEARMYTLHPEPFVLATLFVSDPKSPPLKSFRAQDVFRGHLERVGNARILSNVTVTVQHVIYAHQFDVNEKRSEQLDYIVFGKGNELVAAHLITAPPDFDQILPVHITGRTFTAEELHHGVRLSIPERKNVATARLKKQDRVTAQVMAGSGTPARVQVAAAGELYFEEGELFIPPQFDQTEEEKKAGFTEQMLS